MDGDRCAWSFDRGVDCFCDGVEEINRWVDSPVYVGLYVFFPIHDFIVSFDAGKCVLL